MNDAVGAFAGVVLLMTTSAWGVVRLQPRLAQIAHEVKQLDDVYALPPPSDLRRLTLGYHAAATDLLWAKLLVEYGTHWAEHRPFDVLPRYLDAILALEPDYAPLYKFVDTLVVYRPPRGTEADARLARSYLERGVHERPYDANVWLQYGQFLAFLAPSFMERQEEKDRWRREGADAIARAVELGADADRSISAATILGRYGERDAAIRHLRAAYALTDDPSVREQIAAKLTRLEASAEREAAERTMKQIESRWRTDFPFLSRSAFLLMGPVPGEDCVGVHASNRPECAHEWTSALSSGE